MEDFAIVWSIPESQWSSARATIAREGRASNFDRSGLGRYYLLNGEVDFEYRGARLYADLDDRRGVGLSLFDLAIALADAYLGNNFIDGVTTIYEQLDDERRIEFACEAGNVSVRTSDRQAVLVVPIDAFRAGILTFLCAVGNALDARVEGALEWESLRPLKEVVARFCTETPRGFNEY